MLHEPQTDNPEATRYTITDFNRQFPDDAACLEHLKEQRFPGGIAHCEKCDRSASTTASMAVPCIRAITAELRFPRWQGRSSSIAALRLRLWYYAMYLMASTRCGISAKQIQRETGVTYKTAWRMFRQIRSLLSEPEMQLEGSSGGSRRNVLRRKA